MNEVFNQVQKRPYSLQPLSAETLKAVWDALSMLIARTLTNGKGFGMSNFGVWTFRADCQDLGLTKKTLKTPVFILSEKFARNYNIQMKKQLASGGIPVVNLNTLAIASMAGKSRDEVAAALKDIFLYVGDVARSGRPVRLEFAGVGQFVCSNSVASFTFYPPFSGTYEVLGFSARAPLRPSTAPMRGGSYPLDWEAQPMRPPSTGRPGTTSRPSTAGGFEARDAPVESARRMSRPSTANGAGLFTQSAREPQYQEPDTADFGTFGGGKTATTNSHAAYCRCKHCVVRANYNRQIEEKYAKLGLEEKMDRELVQLAKTRNELEMSREQQQEAARRRVRHEIEQFNSEYLGNCMQTKKQFGPLPFDDMFQHKIAEERAVMKKEEIREALAQQLQRKQAEKEKAKEEEKALFLVADGLLKMGLEKEKEKERELKRDIALQRRRELETQMKSKRTVLTDPVASAVWDKFPKSKPTDFLERRERNKKLQEEVLSDIRQREVQREREKAEEDKRVQEELKRLQETVERQNHEGMMEEVRKKQKAREIWTSQMTQRKTVAAIDRKPLLGSTGFVVGDPESSKHIKHEGEPVPLSHALLGSTLPFR